MTVITENTKKENLTEIEQYSVTVSKYSVLRNLIIPEHHSPNETTILSILFFRKKFAASLMPSKKLQPIPVNRMLK